MAQYVFFMILSLGLYFVSPSTSNSGSGSGSGKKAKKSLRVLKTDGGDNGWEGGGL